MTEKHPNAAATAEVVPLQIYVKLVASVTLWGGTWIAGRHLAQYGAPFGTAFLRFLVASIFLYVLTSRLEGAAPRLERTSLPVLLGLGATGVFLYNVLFFTGLQTVEAGRAALIVAAIPAVLACWGRLVHREPFTGRTWLGVAGSFAGVCVILGHGDPAALLRGGLSFGDVCILGCVASWTAYTLLGRRAMVRHSPHATVTWSCLLGAAMLAPFAALEAAGVLGGVSGSDVAAPGAVAAGAMFYLGVLSTGLAFSWYYEAVRALGATRAGVFINLVPVTAVLLGALLLGERFGPAVLLGGGMVLAGVWLTNSRSRRCRAG